ncbi:MAG: trimethylamine methyltransferase family protein [Gammaproteobacteria bacterium]|nr:trimethylamine methyltransferase family protein [Gammaproteobacteria bacterium]
MTRQRTGRRSARRADRKVGAVHQREWAAVHNAYPPFEILDPERIESLHLASLKILQELGIEVLHPSTRDLLRREGAGIDGERVYFAKDMVEEKIGLAPAEFELRARNPERSVTIGGNRMVFCAVGGPAFCTDIDRGRRAANFADMCDLTRLTHMLNAIHVEGGGAVEPTDLPVETRHLDMYQSFITLTDKAWTGYGLGAFRANDAIDMAAIALGTDRAGLADRPAAITVINSNSPLRLDGPMAEGLTAFAAAGQPFAATPFTLSGAMAPATVAGASVQQNAEALAMIAIAQCVRPGAPVIYGGFTSNVDMKTGAPAFGTPEYAQSVLIGCQLARRYNVPFRTSNVTACNTVDAQAAYESQMSLWPAVLGHAQVVKHCAGWLEGGLTASFEKFILDAEMIQMMAAFLSPPAINEDAFGIEAIAEVGPGGHFFGTGHTLARYETAFYDPMLSDWRNFEAWTESGSEDATIRANRIWKQLLAEYEEPSLDPAIAEQLDVFVAQRKEEINKTR